MKNTPFVMTGAFNAIVWSTSVSTDPGLTTADPVPSRIASLGLPSSFGSSQTATVTMLVGDGK